MIQNLSPHDQFHFIQTKPLSDSCSFAFLKPHLHLVGISTGLLPSQGLHWLGRGWGSAPLLVVTLMLMLRVGTMGFVLPAGSWEKTVLRMDLSPSGIAATPKLGLWCRAFSNYTYSFFLSSPSPCEQRGAQWPLLKNTSTSKILMSSSNLQDSSASEVFLGAILRAFWWYHPWLRPVVAEGATSQCQVLLCSFSYWDKSELWGTDSFPTMQWTSFSLACERSGELLSSCCSPLTQRIPDAQLSHE